MKTKKTLIEKKIREDLKEINRLQEMCKNIQDRAKENKELESNPEDLSREKIN